MDSRQNLINTLNVRNIGTGVSTLTDEAAVIRTKGNRYVDPLVLRKQDRISVPEMREAVCEYDAIANLLTEIFSMNAWDKMPKFYESEQLGTPEILMDLRAILHLIDFENLAREVFYKCSIHGWAIIYPKFNDRGKLDCEIYSEYMIPAQQIYRNADNNIAGYRIHKIPRIPLNRNKSFVRIITRTFVPEEVIHATRAKYSYGFGLSRLSGCWDAITKIREESNNNAFRSKSIPWARFPEDWTDDDIDEFMEALARADQFNAIGYRQAQDMQTGQPLDTPSLDFLTPSSDVKQKSDSGTGGQMHLSSEWARLCTATGRTAGYFVGGGALSASRAAAGVDTFEDLDADISDFNLFKSTFIIPMIEWIAEYFQIPLPPFYTIKSWWEWTRDEQQLMQMMQEQQQQQQQMELEHKKIDSETKRTNLIPGVMYPVNSQSGNVEAAMITQAPGEAPVGHIKFEGNSNYKYQDTSIDMDAAITDVVQTGGEGVWKLRGLDSAPRDEKGLLPKGMPKRSRAAGGPKPTPLAGKPHDVYGSSYQATPNFPTDKKDKPKSRTDKFLDTVKGIFGRLSGIFGRGRSNIGIVLDNDIELDESAYIHPILRKYDTVTNYRKNEHIGYKKAKGHIYDPEDCSRLNLSFGGNAFNTDNKFLYVIDDEVRIEYQCPDSIRENVGKKVPFGIWHNLDDPAAVDLPQWQQIGTYELLDFDGKKDQFKIDYFDDWETRANEIIFILKKLGLSTDPTTEEFLDNFIINVKNGLHPDISTAYTTRVEYHEEKNRFIQNNIDLKSVSAVPIGNCTKPNCNVTTATE